MNKVFLTITAATMLLASCGGGGGESKKDSSKKEGMKIEQKTQEKAEKDVPETVEITIEGDDQMKFNMKKIEVYEGQTVKLTLKHVGKMTKKAMGHNWVLLAKGVDKAAFGAEAAGMENGIENDHVPADRSEDIIAHTKLLGGGEETTIEFEAPEAGGYDFMCSFPGHYATMNGKFIVKKP